MDEGNENGARRVTAKIDRKDNITTLKIFSGLCNYF